MPDKNTKEYYLGNESLPNQHAQFEYSPKKIAMLKKAKANLLYFAEHFFSIVNIDRGREVIALRSYQKRVLRKMRDNRFVIVLSSRQSGKTTMMTIYALWLACFQTDQKIVLVANKEQTAKDIFGRVRLAYEELPNWSKPGVLEYGKESMVLANGSRIGISTTTGTAARGMSCNVLILDELAFIEPHIVEEFWKSVYPTISSSKKSKIFICSTPNGTENLFYKLYTGAANGTNGWTPDKVSWQDVPGRDNNWKEQNIRLLGSVDAFNQEFGCDFIQTGTNMLDENLIAKMNSTCREPIHVLDEGLYKVWSLPERDRIYVAGVDISEGVGAAASCIQILDITELSNIEQVATFHSSTTSPYEFTTKLNSILKHWGQPIALIERNNCGAQVVDMLKNNYYYPNMVTYTGSVKTKSRVGVLAHTNTKYRGVMNMRYWVNEQKGVTIRDKDLVQEFKTFIRRDNGTWGHIKAQNVYDDRVMSILWALFILSEDLISSYFDVTLGPNNKPIGISQSNFAPGEFEDMGVGSISDADIVPAMFGGLSIDSMESNKEIPGGVQDYINNGWKYHG